MISYLVNGALFIALVGTSVIVVGMHRRLKRFEANQAAFGKVLAAASESLDRANQNVSNLNAEAKDTLLQLSAKIDEAKRLLAA